MSDKVIEVERLDMVVKLDKMVKLNKVTGVDKVFDQVLYILVD